MAKVKPKTKAKQKDTALDKTATSFSEARDRMIGKTPDIPEAEVDDKITRSIVQARPMGFEACGCCNGRGFIEYDAGLLQVKCQICDGTGKVAVEPMYIGILLQISGKVTDKEAISKLRRVCEESAAQKIAYPHTIIMPCGNEHIFESIYDIIDDFDLPIGIPCPCGNPNHYIVKFEDNREVKNGDTARDGIAEGNTDSGSTDTGVNILTQEPSKGT